MCIDCGKLKRRSFKANGIISLSKTCNVYSKHCLLFISIGIWCAVSRQNKYWRNQLFTGEIGLHWSLSLMVLLHLLLACISLHKILFKHPYTFFVYFLDLSFVVAVILFTSICSWSLTCIFICTAMTELSAKFLFFNVCLSIIICFISSMNPPEKPSVGGHC